MKMISTMVPALAGLLVATTAPALAAAPLPQPLPQDFYRVQLSQPASVDELVAAVADAGLEVRSVRHAGETTGELLVGDEPFASAAETYKETNVDAFGVEPSVVSFVTTDAPSADLLVGDAGLASVTTQDRESLDPTVDGEVSPANIQDAWAPARGTVYAYNASTGSPRRVRHRLTWDSRAGLDSYDDYAYEHDNKLDDPDAEVLWLPDGSTHCISEHWVAHRDTTIVSSGNVPSGAGLYADNARQFEECGYYDISFGLFNPGKLSSDVQYTVVIGGESGSRSSSPQGLSGQKLSNDCQMLPDGDYCIGLNESRPGTDSTPLIGAHRGWAFPGCYTWTRGGSPVKGSCP